MADVKRKFYNAGDAKGFTKEVFFQTVLALVTDGEADQKMIDLVGEACEYELEGIQIRRANGKGASGEKKDPLESDYAVALKKAASKFITSTPQTAAQILDQMNKAGEVAPSGKPFATPWTSRVLNAMDGVVAVKTIVETTNAKGLKAQKEVNAYKKG